MRDPNKPEEQAANPLYGQSAGTEGAQMYGQAAPQPLSMRNQDAAKQLNLPGAQSSNDGIAGSQQEAQSDWANFEDIFNANRGYAAKGVKAATDKVEGKLGVTKNDLGATVGDQNAQPQGESMFAPKGPQASAAPQAAPVQAPTSVMPGAINPQAPQTLQSDTIMGVQQKADLMQGYGDPAPAPQALGGGTKRGVGAPPAEEAVAYQQANTAGSKTKGPVTLPQAPTPAVKEMEYDENGNPKDPFGTGYGPAPAYDAEGNPVDPAAGPILKNYAPADSNRDGTVTETEQLLFDREHPAGGKKKQTVDLGDSYKAAQLQAQRDAAADVLANAPRDQLNQADRDKSKQLWEGQDMLDSWGIDGGQDLLGDGAGAWDAAIMQTGGGRTAHRELTDKYDGAAQKFDDELDSRLDDASTLRGNTQQQINIFDDLLGGMNKGVTTTGAASATGTDGPSPTWGGFGSLDDFETKVGGGALLHDSVTGLDPTQLLAEGLGEAGVYQGGTVAEGFRNGIGVDKAAGTSIDDQNRLNAFQKLKQAFGPAAAQWAWKYLTQEIWDGMAGQNAGAIYKTLKDLVLAANKDGKNLFHEGATQDDINNRSYVPPKK
jgi:hypothetical protein